MFNMWVSGWCAALATEAFISGNIGTGFVMLGLSGLNLACYFVTKEN